MNSSIDPVHLGKLHGNHAEENQKMIVIHLSLFQIMNLVRRYCGSKGVQEYRQEESPLTSLAVTCHLEENASHHQNIKLQTR